MCPCGLKARYTVKSCCPPFYAEAFMMRHLRSIMRLTWMDKVTNKDIFERAGLPSMDDLLIRRNLRWTRHVTGCHQTGYQSMFSTLNCLLVTERKGALVSGSNIPPRET
ncbi:hypothetical protein NP493_2038g00001 [Ridgeia piscesae]|uniref:Uncharacterized protein n=1 Tax=Ridgeia piscesae TaxID=27915 RepID=A0AAD9JMA5_RIDPI|nr:hypothetical protein NP493_2038g00001 [Ridgeia piscesae]